MERDKQTAYHGVYILLLVSFVYTIILYIFIQKGYVAAAPSVLNLPVDQQYRWQIWYQAPLFFGTTALTSLLLVVISRTAGNSTHFLTAFGRVSLATAVPFAMTTMLVELGAAVLIAVGVLEPGQTLRWLTGSGAWFATIYQLTGLVWLLILMITAVKVSGVRSWFVSMALGILLTLVYGLPVGLFIR